MSLLNYSMGMIRLSFVFLTALILASPLAHGEFALRNDDKVVFLGDSITAAHNYSKIIEDYTLLRFPERHIEFLNVGEGGETAHGSLARLDDAVFANGATVLTVAYGINDIGWGTKANDDTKQAYLDAIRTIIERCHKHGVRVFICSAPITAEDPDTAAEAFLQKMCDQGLAVAKAQGAGTIDVMRSMREVQRKVLAANEKESDVSKHTKLHVVDGVHLNDLGQMAMAWAILKGLGAPAEVSSLNLDAAKGEVVKAEACLAQDLALTAEGGSFVRLDERLPLNMHSLWMLMGWHIPISRDLNDYQLRISGLNQGRYAMTAGGRKLGEWDAGELANGINIASATGEPWEPGGLWDAQGHVVTRLTTVRDLLDQTRATMDKFLEAHPDKDLLRAQLNGIEQQVVTLQRATAKPVRTGFNIKRIDP